MDCTAFDVMNDGDAWCLVWAEAVHDDTQARGCPMFERS
jgi:hypothetical protein